MSQANVYRPGVCNIGPAETRRRRNVGWVGLAVSAIFLIVAFVLGWAAPWRLLVALPVFMTANGFLQAAFHFCVGFGTRGLYNFGELGNEETVLETEFRRKDQRKALLITGLSAGIAIVAALVAFVIPVV